MKENVNGKTRTPKEKLNEMFPLPDISLIRKTCSLCCGKQSTNSRACACVYVCVCVHVWFKRGFTLLYIAFEGKSIAHIMREKSIFEML